MPPPLSVRLYLTTQLAELNTDVIVALNMADILEANGISIDVETFSPFGA
jgi:Fe2+ transport system protein B